MVQDENLYQKVIADYRITNSVKKTAQNVGTSLVRAQRILITEGLWSSHTSEQVGELFRKGRGGLMKQEKQKFRFFQ